MTSARLIGVDWGTSRMRAYLLDESGDILESRHTERGITTCTKETFPQVLTEALASWQTQAAPLPILMAGMVGSKQGWAEVPYLPCPVSPTQLAQKLHSLPLGDLPAPLQGSHLAIVPGITARSLGDLPDVMRGEETQIVGLLETYPWWQEGWLCLPGTHAKWAYIKERKIVRFETFMTGEAFALFSQHGLLSRWIQETPQTPNKQAFLQGAQTAQRKGGVLHQLFGVRALSLDGQLEVTHQQDYLSGVLIGHELQSALMGHPDAFETTIHLVGAGPLLAKYEQACTAMGLSTKVLPGEEAVAKGLFYLAQEAGWLGQTDT